MVNTKTLKRFYFKPYLVFKFQLCSRKMSHFDADHWLQHDRELHAKIYPANAQNKAPFTYQQITCPKTPATPQTPSTPATTTATTTTPANTTTTNTNTQITKQFDTFTDFMTQFKTLSAASLSANSTKLIACLICGAELKFTRIDILKHFQCEHEFNILLNLELTLDDLEIIHALQLNNFVQLCEGVHLRRRCLVRVPPLLVNSSTR